MRTTSIAIAMLIATPAFAQDEGGKIDFNNHCRTCHSLDEGDNRMGPTLHDLDGRKAGSVDGYRYSDAMMASDVVWNAETLEAFVTDPDAVVPGHKMKPYGGLNDAEVRARIVSYLTGEETEADG